MIYQSHELPLVPIDTKHIQLSNIHDQHSHRETGTAFHQAHHRLQTTKNRMLFLNELCIQSRNSISF